MRSRKQFTASSECLRSATNIKGTTRRAMDMPKHSTIVLSFSILWPWVIFNKLLFIHFYVFKTLECQLGVIKVSELIGLTIQNLILKQS